MVYTLISVSAVLGLLIGLLMRAHGDDEMIQSYQRRVAKLCRLLQDADAMMAAQDDKLIEIGTEGMSDALQKEIRQAFRAVGFWED